MFLAHLPTAFAPSGTTSARQYVGHKSDVVAGLEATISRGGVAWVFYFLAFDRVGNVGGFYIPPENATSQ